MLVLGRHGIPVAAFADLNASEALWIRRVSHLKHQE